MNVSGRSASDGVFQNDEKTKVFQQYLVSPAGWCCRRAERDSIGIDDCRVRQVMMALTMFFRCQFRFVLHVRQRA